MKLKDFPTIINSITLPGEPIQWDENPQVIENAQTTEAGTDITDIMRVDKLTVTASYQVSSAWLANFDSWSKSTTKLTVKIFDASTSAYITRYMRMRNYMKSRVQNSKNVSGTYGLWTVTFDLIEF